MATLRFFVKEGKVVDYAGRYFDGISEDGLKAVGNGWVVTICPATKRRPGKIIAHCEREYSDGTATCHREFRLQDGTLGLAGGNVRDRYAYFRKASFQKFLDEFGITAVKREDPNQAFTGFAAYSGRGSAEQNVETDGKVDWHYIDDPGSREYFESPGGNPNLYRGEETHTITDATWVIVETREHYGDNHNYAKILYTQVKDVTSLAPKLRRRKAVEQRKAEVEKALDCNGTKSFESMSQMRREIEDLVGSFPLTPAEEPGEASLVMKHYCSRYQFNGIEFTVSTPKNLVGHHNNLDSIGVRIEYRVAFTGETLHLYAGHSQIAEIKISDQIRKVG